MDEYDVLGTQLARRIDKWERFETDPLSDQETPYLIRQYYGLAEGESAVFLLAKDSRKRFGASLARALS